MENNVYIANCMEMKYQRMDLFWVVMAMLWVLPLLVVLFLQRWDVAYAGRHFLYKSTWVLFVGVMLGWILIGRALRGFRQEAAWVVVYVVLTLASLVLLPFGLGRWEVVGGEYVLNPEWEYSGNFYLSMLVHTVVGSVAAAAAGVSLEGVDAHPGHSSYEPRPVPPPRKSGTGLWGKESWMDHVWDGTGGTFDYIGKHGEFDRNDESRRVSEEIQQFHRAHPDADLSDHFFWDDIRDAETDGYLDD